MIRARLYGWYDPRRNEYRLSYYPADAPVRPSRAFPDKEQVKAFIDKKRASVLWWPPLSRDQDISSIERTL